MASKDLDIQILPFYDDPKKASRFNKYCDPNCVHDLVTNQNYLPAFLLTRSISLAKIKEFRVECLDGSDPQNIDLFEDIPSTNFYTPTFLRNTIINHSNSFVVIDDGSMLNDQFNTNINNIGKWNFFSFSFSWREPVFNEVFINNSTGTLWFWNGTTWVDTELTDLWEFKTIKELDFVAWQGWRLKNELSPGVKQVYVEDEDGNKWYSEPIHIKCNTDEYNILRWRNDLDVGCIPYSRFTNFYQTYYINCDVVQPSYPKTIETEENNFGLEKVVFQKFNKLYNLNIPGAPEFVIDNLNFVGLHDDITIKLNNDTNFYSVSKSSFQISTDWVTECEATVNMQFSYESDIITTGCNEGLEYRDLTFYTTTFPYRIIKGRRTREDQLAIEAASPEIGDCYLIDPIPGFVFTPSWSLNTNRIACWNGSDWDFSLPNECDIVYNLEDSTGLFVTFSDFPVIPPLREYHVTPQMTLSLFGITSHLIDVEFSVLNSPDLFLRVEHSTDGINYTEEAVYSHFKKSFSKTFGLYTPAATHYIRATLFNNNEELIFQNVESVS